MTRSVIQIRVSAEQKQALQEAASLADMTLTEYILSKFFPKPISKVELVEKVREATKATTFNPIRDYSKCCHPMCLCSLENRPICGPCKEANQ